MGVICKCDEIKIRKIKREIINSNSIKSKSNKNDNEIKSNKNANKQTDDEYGTPEELQEIIDYLLQRKVYLENTYGKLNIKNIDNRKRESIKDYQLMIDKLSKEVYELEKINNLLENQNKNIQIRFFFEGHIHTINVSNETKLGDAFKNAILNDKFKGIKYTRIMNNETTYTNDDFKNTGHLNYEQMLFLLNGENVTENFKNNKPVSSLVKNSTSFISVIVENSLYTEIMKTYYNSNYNSNYNTNYNTNDI